MDNNFLSKWSCYPWPRNHNSRKVDQDKQFFQLSFCCVISSSIKGRSRNSRCHSRDRATNRFEERGEKTPKLCGESLDLSKCIKLGREGRNAPTRHWQDEWWLFGVIFHCEALDHSTTSVGSRSSRTPNLDLPNKMEWRWATTGDRGNGWPVTRALDTNFNLGVIKN